MAELGNLVVTLEANMARFTQNMDDAARRTEAGATRMQAGLNAAKLAIGALAGAATVGLLANLVKGAIDAADNLRDMSQKTGIAVEELSGLGFAAGQAGGSLEGMVSAAGKLNRSIADAAGGGKETGAAFKALGINVNDASGNLKKADVVMAEVADQFAKYRDGPEKAAIALALFGKAGADMIPLLNDGGSAMRENVEYAKKYSGQTTELSTAADNFNDTMGKLEIQQRGFANAVAAQVLPVLQQLASAMLGASEESRKFDAAAGVIAKSVQMLSLTAYNATADFRRLGVVVAGVAEVNSAFYSGGIEGARQAKAKITADLAEINAAQNKFRTDVKNGGPVLNPIEQFVAKYSKAIDDEKALLGTRLQMLNKYYNDEHRDEKAFNAAKKSAYAEAEANTKTFYDAQIAALLAAKGKGLGDPIALQGRIDDMAAKRSLVGSERPAAPRLTKSAGSTKESKSDEEKALDAGAKLAANLQRQEAALGLTGAALLTYNMTLDGASAAQIRAAQASQTTIDAYKAEEDAASKQAVRAQKEADDAKRLTDQNAANVEQIRVGLLSESAAQDEAHAYRLEQLQIFQSTRLENEILANTLMEEETARHEAVKAETRLMADQQALGMAGDSASQLYSLMQQAGMEQTALGKALFIANKAIAVAEILVSTEVAAAKALTIPVVGVGLAAVIRGMGYASAALTAGMAIASAEGGYDIPAGTNPITQLHEQEMVLPKAQANVIRDMAAGGASAAQGISQTNNIHIDARTDRAEVHRMVLGAVQDGNADLVERLQRAGRI